MGDEVLNDFWVYATHPHLSDDAFAEGMRGIVLTQHHLYEVVELFGETVEVQLRSDIVPFVDEVALHIGFTLNQCGENLC